MRRQASCNGSNGWRPRRGSDRYWHTGHSSGRLGGRRSASFVNRWRGSELVPGADILVERFDDQVALIRFMTMEGRRKATEIL